MDEVGGLEWAGVGSCSLAKEDAAYDGFEELGVLAHTAGAVGAPVGSVGDGDADLVVGGSPGRPVGGAHAVEDLEFVVGLLTGVGDHLLEAFHESVVVGREADACVSCEELLGVGDVGVRDGGGFGVGDLGWFEVDPFHQTHVVFAVGEGCDVCGRAVEAGWEDDAAGWGSRWQGLVEEEGGGAAGGRGGGSGRGGWASGWPRRARS